MILLINGLTHIIQDRPSLADFPYILFYFHLKSIVRGRGSSLIDPRTIHEYDGMNNRIGYWDREVIYYYIDNFQNRN